ncbi:MAG: cobalamin-independent methionine synthase II family protein [Solirubrobacteraceae bacterium]
MSRNHSHVVGSMLRPPELLEARERFRSGAISATDFRAIEDRAVDTAIARQDAAGIDVITDGEQRREDFMEGLLGAVSGTEEVVLAAAAGDAPPVSGSDETGFWHRADPGYEPKPWIPPVVTGKIARTGSIAGEEYAYARARASRPVKVTLPSPLVMLSYWSQEHSLGVYASAQEMVQDFADVLHQEIVHLASLGCRYIQIDAPELTFLVGDGAAFGLCEMLGYTRESFLGSAIELLNGVADAPGVTFSVHLCRGNKEGEWHSSGGYEAVSGDLFGKLDRFEYLLLEFDDERSGDFGPLQDVPDDTCVVLGLVSTKRAAVEDHDALVRRIGDAARFHPLEQLAISPQCGFASILYGNPIPSDAERAKLELVGEIGHELWL